MAAPETVAKCIITLVIAYPDANVPIETQRVYKEALADIPDEALKLATTQIIATSKWFPKIAELREAAARLMTNEAGRLSAGEAWAVFKKLSNHYANDEPLSLEAEVDPVIRKTINAMGWKYLCASEDGMADRAHFMKTYDAIVKREANEAQMPPQLKANNPALMQLQGLAKQLSGGNTK